METKIQKEPRLKKTINSRLTKEEYKAVKKICKEQKITISWLIRSSLQKLLESNN